MSNPEWALAPWNATRYPYGNAIFWHFHDVRLAFKNGKPFAPPSPYVLPKPTQDAVYKPYHAELIEIAGTLQTQGIVLNPQTTYSWRLRLRRVLGRFYRAFAFNGLAQ